MVQVNQVLHHYLDSAFLFSPCVSRLSQSRFDTGSCSPKQQLFLPCFFLSLAFVVIQTVYATYTRIGIRHGVSIVPVHNEGVYVASRLTLFFCPFLHNDLLLLWMGRARWQSQSQPTGSKERKGRKGTINPTDLKKKDTAIAL